MLAYKTVKILEQFAILDFRFQIWGLLDFWIRNASPILVPSKGGYLREKRINTQEECQEAEGREPWEGFSSHTASVHCIPATWLF
jgi:hypothetical protein